MSLLTPHINLSAQPQSMPQNFINTTQYVAAIPIQPVITTTAFTSQTMIQPIPTPFDYLQPNVVLTPAQNQIQDQLQRKHEELKHLIQQQQEELRRVSEQLMMARYGIMSTVVASPFSVANIPDTSTRPTNPTNENIMITDQLNQNIHQQENKSQNIVQEDTQMINTLNIELKTEQIQNINEAAARNVESSQIGSPLKFSQIETNDNVEESND